MYRGRGSDSFPGIQHTAGSMSLDSSEMRGVLRALSFRRVFCYFIGSFPVPGTCLDTLNILFSGVALVGATRYEVCLGGRHRMCV